MKRRCGRVRRRGVLYYLFIKFIRREENPCIGMKDVVRNYLRTCFEGRAFDTCNSLCNGPTTSNKFRYWQIASPRTMFLSRACSLRGRTSFSGVKPSAYWRTLIYSRNASSLVLAEHNNKSLHPASLNTSKWEGCESTIP